jgi:hypothetical protein
MAGTVLSRTVAGVLMLWALTGLVLAGLHASTLFSLDEAGFGDSYILYDVLHFQRTGVLYRDLADPPYLPAQYSPMVYFLYSLPGRLAVTDNPFVGPRIAAFTSFALCAAVVVSITRTLVPRLWGWAALLTCSVGCMWPWVLQLRGDFPGIFLNLLAIRLLLAQSRTALLGAGICAGLATQFKIILVAALASGTLWLLAQRRWRDAATFTMLGAVSSLGLYLLFYLREPRMLSQIFALSPGIADVSGCLRLMREAGLELVVPLAILGLSSTAFRGPRWKLLVAFVVISFALAAVFDVQAGGNVNYFYEALFGAVPLAVLGIVRVRSLSRRQAIVGAAATVLLVGFYGIPRGLEAYELARRRFAAEPNFIAARNHTLSTLEQTLRGRRIFSTVPRFALFDPAPALTEPYLFTYQERLGKFDPRPILDRVRGSEFDVVITLSRPGHWRGVLHISPSLRQAIAESYRPHCVLDGSLMHLPRRPRPESATLASDLNAIGCAPASGNDAARW